MTTRKLTGEELTIHGLAFIETCKDGTKEEYRIFHAGFMAGSDYWREFAYLLAGALADEAHYSQTPSEDTLALLNQAKEKFVNTEFVQRYDELKIDELVPVE